MATGAQPLPRDRPVQFGKYTLLSQIASGGMGELYLAQLRAAGGFEKLVVIKRILPHLTGQREFVEMFVEEARTAARITHPNVCQIYELGQVDGRYYMALEYLEGVPLADVMVARKRAPQLADLRLIASLIAQAAEGLHHAHALRGTDGESSGVVHRDVNPRNIFVTSAGVAKVLDFGIVKVRGALNQTKTGSVKGTYSYMAPEQLQGEPLDATADIFALGTITWEAVVGRRLFKRASDLLTWRAIVDEPVPRPSQFRYDLPADLDDAIMRALGKRRDERYQTAREFALALERAIKPLGAPYTTLAISSEIERAFANELNEQRARVFSAHKEQEAARLGGSPMGPEADWGDASVGSQATRVADEDYGNLVATTSAIVPAMPARSTQPRRVASEPPLHTPSELHTIDEPGVNPSMLSPSRPSAQRRVPPLRAPAEQKRSGNLVSTSSFVDEVPPGVEFEPSAWPPTGPSKVLRPESRSGIGSQSVSSRPRPMGARGRDLRSRSPWPMVLALVVFGVGAAAFAYVLKKDSVPPAESAASAVGAPAAATPGSTPAPAPAAATPAPAPATAPATEASPASKPAEDPAELPAVATPVPPAAEKEPEKEPEKPAPVAEKKPEPKKAEPKKATAKKPEPKKAEPKKAEPAVASKGGSGFLTLNAEPYATVYIDGKKRGFTPIVKLALPPGSHSIRLVSSAGQPDKKMTVKVGAGEDVRKFVKW